MKIKFDENLPVSLKKIACEMGYDADTVLDEHLQGCADDIVWRHTQKESRFFVTQDLDFSNNRRFKPGQHSGILLLRLKNPGRNQITAKLSEIFHSGLVKRWKRCFVVVTDTKIRVSYPK